MKSFLASSQYNHTHTHTVWPQTIWPPNCADHTGTLAKKSHHTLEWLYCCVVSRATRRSAGQTSLVIVLERGGVCQGLDPGSRWPTSHLVLATANPSGRPPIGVARLLLGRMQTGEKKNKKTHKDTAKIPSLSLEEALRTRGGILLCMNR